MNCISKFSRRRLEPAFPAKLPVAIWTKGTALPQIKVLDMTEKTLTASFLLTEKPGRVLIDPYTEVFRKLDRREVPPAIGQTYGSPLPARIMPTQGDFPDVLMGYHEFAQSLVKDSNVMGPLLNDDKSSPVPNGSLWVFGRTNSYARRLKPQLENYGVKLNENNVVIEGRSFPWKDHSFVFTLQRPGSQEGSVTWIIASSGESIPGLIRKLPHYGKYGVLVFKGHEPENKFKRNLAFPTFRLDENISSRELHTPASAPVGRLQTQLNEPAQNGEMVSHRATLGFFPKAGRVKFMFNVKSQQFVYQTSTLFPPEGGSDPK